MNRSMMEKARSMLSGAGLGQELWALVVDTTCYLKNRAPTSALVDKTPYEVWFGQKPSVAHLIIFGCEAFMHVPKEKRRSYAMAPKARTYWREGYSITTR